MVALAMAAAGVGPVVALVNSAGNQSKGRALSGPQAAGRREGRGAGAAAEAAGRPGRDSPKSMKRMCSCSGRLTPRARRLEAWICRSRARPTSGALRVVAEEEGT